MLLFFAFDNVIVYGIKNISSTQIILTWYEKTEKSERMRIMANKKNSDSDNKEYLCEEIGGESCGLKKVIDLVGGKWKIMILCVMDREGTIRYGDLRRRIHGITNTMRAKSLKEMEQAGLVDRKQYMEMPVRVEYSLTKKAESIVPILLELKRWGEENL